MEVELDFTGGAITVLGEDEVGDMLAVGVGIVIVLAIDKRDDIGVLFDRT